MMEGRCQCSRIKFTTPLAVPLKIYICHCTECRHQSSSAFGITCVFPAFDIPEPSPGALGTYTRSNSVARTVGSFCTRCGSRLVHRSVANATGKKNDLISVKGGCLDGLTKEMMRNAVHIWTREAIVYIPPGSESYDGEPEE